MAHARVPLRKRPASKLSEEQDKPVEAAACHLRPRNRLRLCQTLRPPRALRPLWACGHIESGRGHPDFM